MVLLILEPQGNFANVCKDLLQLAQKSFAIISGAALEVITIAFLLFPCFLFLGIEASHGQYLYTTRRSINRFIMAVGEPILIGAARIILSALSSVSRISFISSSMRHLPRDRSRSSCMQVRQFFYLRKSIAFCMCP